MPDQVRRLRQAHVRFDVEPCVAHARAINPGIQVLWVSAKTGEGMEGLHEWLRQERARPATAPA